MGHSRSWISTAKSVLEIGGMYYSPKVAELYDYDREDRAEKRFQERLFQDLPASNVDRNYFGSRMHDGGVVALERQHGNLWLKLENINAADFSRSLSAVLGVETLNATWPTSLVLHDVACVRAASTGLQGGLRFLRPDSLVGAILLYDWFFEQDGRLQWVAEFWNPPKNWKPGSHEAYLMVDCARATAVDQCPAEFDRSYGSGAGRLYLDAVERIDGAPIDFNVYDSGEKTEAYIRRRMVVNGFDHR